MSMASVIMMQPKATLAIVGLLLLVQFCPEGQKCGQELYLKLYNKNFIRILMRASSDFVSGDSELGLKSALMICYHVPTKANFCSHIRPITPNFGVRY